MIGVVGAYGDVGTCATRYLARWGAQPLRLGGRDVGAARRLAERLPGARVECCAVDVDDAASLDRFARDCRVLLSCAGPSHAVLDRVSQAALRAGAEYVDAAGDDVLHARLSNDEYVAARRVAVLSAGLHPGLTALAPRWAALQGFTHIRSLASYFGLRDDFTPTAADDYLEGAERSISLPLAAWRGEPRRGVLTRRREADVPFFPAKSTLLPYLDTEGERLASALGLQRGDWFMVIAGEHVLAAFDRVRGLDRAQGVEALCAASRLDRVGRESYVSIAVQVEGEANGVELTKAVVVQGRRNAELTGAVAAFATVAVLGGQVRAGRHYAADVLDPAATLQQLRAWGAASRIIRVDGPLERLATSEEGAL